MKTQHEIYNETYDNTDYRALTNQIDARKSASKDEKDAAVNLIIDLAVAYSDPHYADVTPVRRPYIVKKTHELAEFAFNHGLTPDFLKQCEHYFNRFRAAAVAEAMVIDWTPSTYNKFVFYIGCPVDAHVEYFVEHRTLIPRLYIYTPFGQLTLPLTGTGRSVDDLDSVVVDFEADVPLVREALAKVAFAGLGLFAPVYS